LILQETVTQDVVVYGQHQQIRYGRLLKYGEQVVTAVVFVVVCKAFQVVQEVMDVKCLKLNLQHNLHYAQVQWDVADQQIMDVQDVEVMLVHQLDVATEHTFAYVHQAVDTVVQTVTLERLQEHTVVAQLTFADVFTGQTLQFADFTEAEQVHQCVQVQPSN